MPGTIQAWVINAQHEAKEGHPLSPSKGRSCLEPEPSSLSLLGSWQEILPGSRVAVRSLVDSGHSLAVVLIQPERRVNSRAGKCETLALTLPSPQASARGGASGEARTHRHGAEEHVGTVGMNTWGEPTSPGVICLVFKEGEEKIEPYLGHRVCAVIPLMSGVASNTEADAIKVVLPLLHRIRWGQLNVNGQRVLPPMPSPHGSGSQLK